MTAPEYFVFETGFGWMGLMWRGDAIVRLFMAERERGAIERRAARFDPAARPVDEAALPAAIAAAVDGLLRYADGESVDFSSLAVDAGDVGPMREAIYAALRGVGYGETVTYGELAARAGYPGMAREIGEAMGRNPVPVIVPCHRVIAAGGKIGGFSAPGGSRTKERLLALEGVRLGPPPPAQAAFTF